MVNKKSKRKNLIPWLLSVILLVAAIGFLWKPLTASVPELADKPPKAEGLTVLIDAGHGGFDVGAVGVSGTQEQLLNLEIARTLERELELRGVPYTMTRTDEAALGRNKSDDMANRAAMIRQSSAKIMVSIHMNTFAQDSTVSGPQVFYQEGSTRGESLAAAVQAKLNALGGKRSHSSNDLMVLRAGNAPAILVECGFISNPEEEALLREDGYQKKLAAAIADGLEAWWQENGGKS